MPATSPNRRNRSTNRRLTIGAGAAVLVGVLTALAVSTSDSTPSKPSPPDISVENVKEHLTAFEDIADEHGGNRAHGEPGYRASLDYVRKKLDAAGYETTVQEFDNEGTTGYNLIADWPSETGDQVLVVGAHLDSTEDGPGINDNASGAAAILETALAVSREELDAASTIRFAWWDAEEEIDLFGSSAYVEELSQKELDGIRGYLNFDMIASANPGYFVFNEDSELGRVFVDYFAEQGIETESDDGADGDSDYASFESAGVPFGGVFTGASDTMSKEQAAKWDGQAGEPFDDCYHSECDTLDNVDETALDRNSDAIAHAVWHLTST